MNKLYKTAVLGNGVEILLRPVPPHVQIKIAKAVEMSVPPPPDMPKIEWETADGRKEPVPAGPDDAEYKQWMKDREEWAKEYGPQIEDAEYNISAALYDYRIVGWRFPTNILWRIVRSLLNIWQKQPPGNWNLVEVGGVDISTSIGPRADYIMTEIIQDGMDYAAIRGVHEEVERVVTKEEVEATASTFPGDDRTGDRPETVRGDAPDGEDRPGGCVCAESNAACGDACGKGEED